jgi:hypothetical protein
MATPTNAKGKFCHLWIDQWGNRYFARTVKDLKVQVGPGAVHKIYRDKLDGRSVHCGYSIGQHWFDRYAPVELPA